jgi:hypothetical protein
LELSPGSVPALSALSEMPFLEEVACRKSHGEMGRSHIVDGLRESDESLTLHFSAKYALLKAPHYFSRVSAICSLDSRPHAALAPLAFGTFVAQLEIVGSLK